MASHNKDAKDANIYHGQVVGHGIGSTINMVPEATKPAKPEPPMVAQHAEQYTSSYTAYPAPHRRPPAPYMRPQKPSPLPYYGGVGGDGYWGEATGAYGGGGYYEYRPPQPPLPYGGGGGDGGGYGYYPPSEFGWGGGGYNYYGGGHGGGGYGGGYGGGGYGGGGGNGGGGDGYGGGHAYGRPPPHMSAGWLAAAGATAYGAYQHHMRKHHQGHGHGHGGDYGCSCGRGCSHGSCAAMHGEFEHEHHTKFKHSTAHHDVKYGEYDAQAPHVTVLEKRTTEVVQA